MNIDDVKKILSENHIRLEFIKINDKYLIPGDYYLYYEESSFNWYAFHYDREYKDERFFQTVNRFF